MDDNLCNELLKTFWKCFQEVGLFVLDNLRLGLVGNLTTHPKYVPQSSCRRGKESEDESVRVGRWITDHGKRGLETHFLEDHFSPPPEKYFPWPSTLIMSYDAFVFHQNLGHLVLRCIISKQTNLIICQIPSTK